MELRAARMLALLIAAGLSGLPAADGHEFRCGSWAETGLDLHPAEEEALVAFRDAIEEDNGLLETWVDEVHPCKWEGVICDCESVYPPQPDCPAAKDPEFEHVFGLDFGSRKPSDKRLSGTLTRRLANLPEARILYLHSNKLRGPIPPDFGTMENLCRLLIYDNLLTGTLPPELGDANFKELDFHTNYFEGTIPEEWCGLLDREDSRLDLLDPGNNQHLCGKVPSCFYNTTRINPNRLLGSCLIYEDAGSREHPGGPCDSTPPVCGAEGGCILLPSITNRLDYFQFTILGFSDPESGIREYRYRVGTRPGLGDAMSEHTVAANAAKLNFVGAFNASGVALSNGKRYYVTVEAVNKACPELSVEVSSTAILVDNTPPFPQARDGQDLIFANRDCSVNSNEQLEADVIHACWHEFIEEESSILKYEIAVTRFVGTGDSALGNLTEFVVPLSSEGISCEEGICKGTRRALLRVGEEYRVLVRSFNIANDFTERQSNSIKVVVPNPFNSTLIAILVGSCILMVVLLVALTVFFLHAWSRRKQAYEKEKQLQKERRQLRRNLKDILDSLLGAGSAWLADNNSLAPPTAESIFELPEVFFVFTDIEESTTMAAADPKAYGRVQEIHDSLMRRQLAFHNGYEINTQGDAFECGFHNIESAIRFCIRVQMDLLDTQWTEEVLALPFCHEKRDSQDRLVFAGPRVRMGIHLGRKGTFSKRLNPRTHHIQFGGPGYHFAEEVGDSGNGGQIIMTGSTYQAARKPGALSTGLVVFNHLGMFQFERSNEPTSIFEVLPPLTLQMPVRQYPLGLRKAKPVAQGCGLRLVTLPKATSLDGKLGIVLVAPPVNTSRENIEVIKDVMCSVGQLFAAYQAFNETLDVTYVLPTTEAAVKFSIVAQSALLCTEFPDREGVSETEYSITGHVLFRGVRTGMVVHCGRLDASRVVASSFRTPGESIAISMQEEQASAQVMMRHTFKGPALDTAALLRPLIHQGQILLSDDAWQTIQAKSLRGIQVMSLGKHEVAGSDAPEQLLEILPMSLAQRDFPPLKSLRCVDPGYREAPGTDVEVAIVFCKVAGAPATPPPGCSKEKMDQLYSEAVMQWCNAVRSALPSFNGYECKEIHGKFTLCFTDIRMAIGFATSIQVTMAGATWSQDLLTIERFAGAKNVGSQPHVRSLMPAIGICWGYPTIKKPLQSTGRADYFGPVPNRAARCMASAAKGQVLVDGRDLNRLLGNVFPNLDEPDRGLVSRVSRFALSTSRMTRFKLAKRDISVSDGSRRVMASIEAMTGTAMGRKLLRSMDRMARWDEQLMDVPTGEGQALVNMRGLGLYKLKGIDEPVSLVQAWLPALDELSSSLPNPKNCVLLDLDAVDKSPVADDSHSSVVLCSDDPDRLTMQKRLDDSEAEGHGGMSDLPGSVGSKSDDEKVLAGHRVELDTTPLIRQHSRLKKSVTICPRT